MVADFAFFIGALLTSARLNRLLVRDTITAPIRAALDAQTGRVSRFAAAALICVWCTGVYTAVIAAAYTHWITGITWWALPLTAGSIAWAAPVLASWLDD